MKKIDYILPIISSVLLIFAFPNFNVWILAWFALIPLFLSLKNKNLKQSFLLGLIFGFVAYLGFLKWIPFSIFHFTNSYTTAIAVWILGALYPALSIAIFCVLYSFARKYLLDHKSDSKKEFFYKILFLLSVPSFWVALEFLQFKLFKGFPWIYHFMGTTQWNNIYVVQSASLVSEIGISFFVVLANYCLYRFYENRKSKEIIFGIIICLLCFAYGIWVVNLKIPNLANEKRDTVKIAILDGNIDSMIKWQDKEKTGNYIAETYLDLNKKALAENPNLIVWTETAIPWPMEEGDDLIEASLNVTAPIGASHIIGMPSYAENDKFYNSVFLVSPDGLVLDKYEKVNLLDFIEKTKKIFPNFYLKLGNAKANYASGEKSKPLNSLFGKIGVLICNEDLYQDYVRNLVKDGSKFILEIGNDSLSNSDTESIQHFIKNYFRAIENRRDIVFANNKGISGSINAYGKIITFSDEKKSRVITTTVEKRDEVSFYNRFGDIFIYFCIFCSLISLFLSFYYFKIKKYHGK